MLISEFKCLIYIIFGHPINIFLDGKPDNPQTATRYWEALFSFSALFSVSASIDFVAAAQFSGDQACGLIFSILPNKNKWADWASDPRHVSIA